jgi:hypothetical protein
MGLTFSEVRCLDRAPELVAPVRARSLQAATLSGCHCDIPSCRVDRRPDRRSERIALEPRQRGTGRSPLAPRSPLRRQPASLLAAEASPTCEGRFACSPGSRRSQREATASRCPARDCLAEALSASAMCAAPTCPTAEARRPTGATSTQGSTACSTSPLSTVASVTNNALHFTDIKAHHATTERLHFGSKTAHKPQVKVCVM